MSWLSIMSVCCQNVFVTNKCLQPSPLPWTPGLLSNCLSNACTRTSYGHNNVTKTELLTSAPSHLPQQPASPAVFTMNWEMTGNSSPSSCPTTGSSLTLLLLSHLTPNPPASPTGSDSKCPQNRVLPWSSVYRPGPGRPEGLRNVVSQILPLPCSKPSRGFSSHFQQWTIKPTPLL